MLMTNTNAGTKLANGGAVVTTNPDGSINLTPASGAATTVSGFQDHGGQVLNLKAFGAKGDGTTDDTAAITAALAAVPPTGAAVYVPPSAGHYLTTGGHVCPNPVWFLGAGKPSVLGVGPSIIECTSPTATLFTLNGLANGFRDLGLVNRQAAPSAGGAVLVTNGTDLSQRCDYDGVYVSGFYDNIDVAVGWYWSMRNCDVVDPVRYGVRVRNVLAVDFGDWNIDGCKFYTNTRNAQSAIRFESGGGAKIGGCKINWGKSESFKFAFGLDANISGTTSDFNMTNCSIENCSTSRFQFNNASGFTFRNIHLANNQMDGPMSFNAFAVGDLSFIYMTNNNIGGSVPIAFLHCDNIHMGGSNGFEEGIQFNSCGTSIFRQFPASNALATTSTQNHFYVPRVAGAPTGIPTTIAGFAAAQYDPTNKKLWVYDPVAAAWVGTVLA